MSLVTLSFIQFNNYFNKILRKPENPFLRSSYSPYPVKSVINGVAFNENDGVTAYHVVPNDIDDVGDYLLVHCNNVIISHWFVTEAKRNRLGQCMVTLQRDLLVDYYETIKTAPAFIERGVLDNDDPMIFNDEGLSFNQIKTDVKPLWDETQCGWLVGYMEKNSDLGNDPITAKVTIIGGQPDFEYSSWSEAPQVLQDLVTGSKKYRTNSEYSLSIKNFGYIRYYDLSSKKAYYIDSISNTSIESGGSMLTISSSKDLANDFVLRANGTVNAKKSTFHSLRNINVKSKTGFDTCLDIIHKIQFSLMISKENNVNTIDTILSINDDNLFNALKLYSDKIIKVDGTLYKIRKITEDVNDEIDLTTYYQLEYSLKNDLYNASIDNLHSDIICEWYNSTGTKITNINDAELELKIKSVSSYFKAEQLGEEATLQFPTSANRQNTLDAQYDMFAIPYPLNNFGYNGYRQFNVGEYQSITVDGKVSLAMAQSIALKLGSKLYDLQLLPYCPFDFKINTNTGYMYLPNEGIDCKYIKVNDRTRSFILFCDRTEFVRDIYAGYDSYTTRHSQLFMNIPKSDDSKTQKVTEKYRLSSGNYASMFDFTPDMNGGVSHFMAYCNFKPYKPFIKVNPIFNYLYGQESFKDANGLILSGDYSITIMSDAWENYMIQNKNFEAMFDRQIQTVEKTNEVNMTNSVFGAISGTFTGTATGAVAGGMKGGVYGAIAGALVGGTASAIGGSIDVNNQAMLMQDNVNLQQQMHAYQIDNIKALPNTIQKVTSLTVVDKIVPILEKFDCTQEEKQMFSNYVRYNGMSVGRIDTIQNFESNGGFIQGRFIRLEGLSEDYHLANAINTTFQAGFYFEED